MSSKASSSYQDFITTKPETVMFVSQEQKALLDDHTDIVVALIRKNLTVKEIHRLFLIDTDGPTYSKTLKTVYRHLDALEKAELIKVAGHRKYEGSRQTEKLYCRSAYVYFQEEPTAKKWWETEEGKQQLEQLSGLAAEFFKKPPQKTRPLVEIMTEYYNIWNENVRKLFQETSRNEDLAELFREVDMGSIKEFASMVGMFGVILDNPSVFDQIREILSS